MGQGNQITRTIGITVTTMVYDYENRLTQVKQGATTLYYEGNAIRRTGYEISNGVFYLCRTT